MKIFWVWNDEKKILEYNDEESAFDSEEEQWQIALDILDTPIEIIIVAPIAWIELEDIDLVLDKNILTIKWNRERPWIYYDDDNTLQNNECYWGKFIRNIILPDNLDFEKIKAQMENNLLQITLPKINISTQNIKINRIWESF